MYRGHRERAIYYTPGVKVLRPQIVLPTLVASNFVQTETKISSLLMLLLLQVFSPWAGLGRDQSSVSRLV